MALFAVALPAYAAQTPYMDALIQAQEYYNQQAEQSALVQNHFPQEAISVFLSKEYFTVFVSNGKIKEIMPGRFDEATVVISTDETTLKDIQNHELTVADAVTLKRITFEATDYATPKTKVAVKVSQLASSVVYFFDSLFV